MKIKGENGKRRNWFLTSRLKSWSTGLLCTGTVLSQEPWDQLALPPFVGFPPEIKQDGYLCVHYPPDVELHRIFLYKRLNYLRKTGISDQHPDYDIYSKLKCL